MISKYIIFKIFLFKLLKIYFLKCLEDKNYANIHNSEKLKLNILLIDLIKMKIYLNL